MTERAVRQGTARAGDAFDLLVGAQGSSVQLMLGAVYLRPQSLPLAPGSAVTEILKQEGVAWAAPLAAGDRWNASPLVGTSRDMVTLGGKRTLAEGRAFAAQDEAVLGAGVPLRLGETFSPMHGQVSASRNEHGHVRYKAVGRLPETGTPWDNAILIPIESVWSVHDALPDAGHGLPLGHLFERKGSPLPGVSAVVVKPESIAYRHRLRAFWQTATVSDAGGRPVNMQGVFTGEVLTALFATLGDMRDIMTGMAYAARVRGPVRGHAGRWDGGIHAQTDARHAACARRAACPAYLVLSVWCVVSASIAVGVAGTLRRPFRRRRCCSPDPGSSLPQLPKGRRFLRAALFRQTGIIGGCESPRYLPLPLYPRRARLGPDALLFRQFEKTLSTRTGSAPTPTHGPWSCFPRALTFPTPTTGALVSSAARREAKKTRQTPPLHGRSGM